MDRPPFFAAVACDILRPRAPKTEEPVPRSPEAASVAERPRPGSLARGIASALLLVALPVVALAETRDAYTDAHADLFTLLAEPFKVALVNAVRHRDVLRLIRLLQVPEPDLLKALASDRAGF